MALALLEDTAIVAAASVTGADHFKSGLPNQDAYRIERRGDLIALAVADGMGSARFAAEGARTAVRTAVASLLADPVPGNRTAAAVRAVRTARRALRQRALTNGHPIKDLACTLIVAFGTPGRLAVAHVGDGAVVGLAEGKPWLLSHPAPTEYVNETDSLTSPQWHHRLRVAVAVAPLEGVAAFTDGCQHAALGRTGTQLTAHAGFFDPLVKHVHANPHSASHDLEALLRTKKLGEHCGDDKTVVIVLWQ